MVAGQILCYTACETTDKFVTFFPSYGVEMRGGTANCYVVIGDEEIGAPMVNHVNNLMVFNTPSFEKFVDYLEPGGNLFINTSVVKERPTRTDINVIEVDAGTIAIELGSSKCLNLVMAGAFVGYTGVLPEENCVQTIFKKLGAKRPEMNPINEAAFRKGLEIGKAARK
ncbi:MAG: 2-oxoacid:acceptor oxidoreductase family protein [Oscillospiraceae bacterium]|nr:2-oxoacid:acceptor oxidoreductase family protein [Oscillospiraceae bacterium]